jgi:CBS domain-containing protein
MYNWKERFENAPDAAMNFANELKAARLGALADAEGWMPLVLAFERLGKFLVNDRKANLGSAKNEIIELAKLGAARVRAGAIDGIPIETLVKLVKDGRNEEFHGGSAARRFTSHCLELGILLADGLKTFFAPMKLRYLMTPNPTCAELDFPLYHARRLMLEGSFTWLPVKHEDSWIGISDHAIVAYTIQAATHYGETIRVAIKGHAESRLDHAKLTLFDEETEIDAVIVALKDHPVLVSAKGSDHVVGIVTAFDLL